MENEPLITVMGKRLAERLLNSMVCEVKLKNCFGTYHTKHEIKMIDLIYIQELGRHIHTNEIESINFVLKAKQNNFVPVDWGC